MERMRHSVRLHRERNGPQFGHSAFGRVAGKVLMTVRHLEIGICGLSCRLCPRYHTDGSSRCGGCKSESRMAAGCPFITCAVKRKGVEFCWDCDEASSCERWAKHRAAGRERDSFTCYAFLDANIAAVAREGLESFAAKQRRRERLLDEMLDRFNEGRSKTYYCIAATVLEPSELRTALDAVSQGSESSDVRERSKALHGCLDEVAGRRSVRLALRK
jgi:hypothetical protein